MSGVSCKQRQMKYMKLTITAVIAAVVISSCTTLSESRPAASNDSITPEMVVNSSPLAQDGPDEDISQVAMLELSPEMISFLDEYVDREESQNERLEQLVYAVIGEGRFQLAYDDSTSTAQDTFRNRRGNCLSFTNMFIAMARDVDLNVSYQEVEVPPDWSMVGQSYLISQHVNVRVDVSEDVREDVIVTGSRLQDNPNLASAAPVQSVSGKEAAARGNALSRVVDFNAYNFNANNESRVISDQRARAHFFNNVGVEHMLADETGLAYANFQQSLREDRSFSSTWVNLGILHRREGYPDYAEAAYLEALKHDRSNLMAMSNLANLYEQEGKTELAQTYLDKVQRHRMGNPYYRYQLANSAFIDGDYESAIKHLKYAIRKRQEEDKFYFLMSLSYLMSGDKKEAQRWMKKAEEVARNRADQRRYHHKLDMLMSQDSGI
jgi:Flp pilus assembly protein TadD